MRHLLRVLSRTPALCYGVLGWLLLSLILTLPSALDRWAPQAHAERSLTAYASVPNLQWRLLLLIALATGIAIASLSRPGARSIVSAFVAVICVVWGSWLVYLGGAPAGADTVAITSRHSATAGEPLSHCRSLHLAAGLLHRRASRRAGGRRQ